MKAGNFQAIVILMFTVFSCSTSDSKKNSDEQSNDRTIKLDAYPTLGKVERLDKRIDYLISEDAVIEVLADGFTWSEGPLWLEDEQKLIFTDVPENTAFEWSEENGKAIYLKPSGNTGEKNGEGANGLHLYKGNKLLLCQHGDRQLAIMETELNAPKSEFRTLVKHYKGKRFNSPNDAVISKNGDIYFTDPPYGLKSQDNDPEKELDFNGVFCLRANGDLELLDDRLTRPNGIALSPNEKTLYVANSDKENAIWMAYTLDNGNVIDRKVLFDATKWVSTKKGLPDGLKVNKDGVIFATGPGGVLVFSDIGEHLGTINTEQATSNCAFDASQSYLYMTAHSFLTRIKLK